MSDKAPNILLLTIDCFRADYMGKSLTPFLDDLAGDSLVFTQAITCGGWTLPSLTALFSSTYASMYGGPFAGYSPERPMLGEILRNHGYTTAGFSTTPQIGQAQGFDRGFDTFVECEPQKQRDWSQVKGAQRFLVHPWTHRLLGALGYSSVPAEVTIPAETLCRQIANCFEQPRHQPAFIWAHFMDAHWPYHRFSVLQQADEIAQAWRDLNAMFSVAENSGRLHPGVEVMDRMQALYAQALQYVDAQIRELVDRLKGTPEWENTLLVVTADHGEEFFEHGRWSHYQLYDESLRVPLILHLPGEESARSYARQVSLIDLAPTLLEAAGAAQPEEMLGQSLLGSIEPRMAAAEAMWPDTYRLALRTETHKYLYDASHPQETRLFDLRTDPAESADRYALDPQTAQEFDRLRQEHMNRGQSQTAPAREVLEMTPEVIERLRALGYLEV